MAGYILTDEGQNPEIDSSFWDTIGLGNFEEQGITPEMLQKYNKYMADLEAFGYQDRSVDAESALNRAGDLAAAQRAEAAYGRQEGALGLAEQAALGKVPSVAELQGRRQLDQSMQQNIGLARSGGGASGMRAALYANAKAGQGGSADAAMLRAQEMANARGQYMQGAQGLSGTAASMRDQAQKRAAMDIGSRESGQDRRLNAGSFALANIGNTLGNITSSRQTDLNRAAGFQGGTGQTGASMVGGGLSAGGAVVDKIANSDPRAKTDIQPASMHSEWGGKSTPSLGGPASIKKELRPAAGLQLDISRPKDLETLLSPVDLAKETFRYQAAFSPMLPVADRMMTGEKAGGIQGAIAGQVIGRPGMGDLIEANASTDPGRRAIQMMQASSRAPAPTARDLEVESGQGMGTILGGGANPMNRGRLGRPEQFMVDALSAAPSASGSGLNPKDFIGRITSAIDSKSDLMPSHMPWGPRSGQSLGGPAEIKSGIAPAQGPLTISKPEPIRAMNWTSDLRSPDQRGAPIDYTTRNWLNPGAVEQWAPTPGSAGTLSDAELYREMQKPMRNIGQEQEAAQAGADAIAQSNSNIDAFLAKQHGKPGDDVNAYSDALKAFETSQQKQKMDELSKAYTWDAPEKDAATPGDNKGLAAKPAQGKKGSKDSKGEPAKDQNAASAGIDAFASYMKNATRPYNPVYSSVPMTSMSMLPGGRPSDPRAKRDMEAAKSPIDDFMEKAEGFTYKYKSPEFEDGTAPPGTTHLGPMADDLREVKGGIGETLTYKDPNTGLLGVNTGRLSLANAAAVNDLHERIKRLEGGKTKKGRG